MNILNVAPPYRLVESRHGWMLANLNDMYMGAAIATYGECNELELAVLLALAEYPGVVVEVGANMGIHTVPLAQALQEKGRQLVAFEPQPVVFQQLCANLALNGVMNVSAWPYACGEKRGAVTFPRPDYRKTGNFGGVSMSNAAPAGGNSSVRVPCFRLDDLLPHERVGLLKIDVEGFELRVLKGGRGLIQRSRPLLYVENDRPDQSRDLIEWLWQAGYSLWWHMPPLFNAQNFFVVAKNIYGTLASLNMLGVPREVNLGVPAGFIRVENSHHHPARPRLSAPCPATGMSEVRGPGSEVRSPLEPARLPGE
jgi:FkbM family methyltransferase